MSRLRFKDVLNCCTHSSGSFYILTVKAGELSFLHLLTKASTFRPLSRVLLMYVKLACGYACVARLTEPVSCGAWSYVYLLWRNFYPGPWPTLGLDFAYHLEQWNRMEVLPTDGCWSLSRCDTCQAPLPSCWMLVHKSLNFLLLMFSWLACLLCHSQ